MDAEQLKHKKMAAVFDLDGTITTNDTYLAFLIGFLLHNKLRIFRCFHLPFAIALYKLRFRSNSWLKSVFLRAIAGGCSRRDISIWTDSFVKQIYSKKLHPEAVNAIQKYKELGYHLVLATASFDFYAVKLGQSLGFDSIICTKSRWENNELLDGRIDGNNCYGEEKKGRVEMYFAGAGSNWSVTAYSDHHSDLPLLMWANHAVAVNPTKALRNFAKSNNIEIQYWRQ